MKIAKIEVVLQEHLGTDLDVANAARVSFHKESDWTLVDGYPRLSERDEKLIKYLADYNHWSPFSHCFLKFRVKAPIFVARQLQKHTVGLAWNEVSRRYVDEEPEFYFPEYWRKKAENKKQGSSDEAVEINKAYDPLNAALVALMSYNAMLESSVAPEQARIILPQNMMTEWIWSGSLYAFARVVNLRTSDHAQKESGEVAGLIHRHMVDMFPVSTKYLVKSYGP